MLKNGLVLGKFMPFHKGHKLLLDTAVGMCEQLTIVVCSLPTEPIPGNLRYEWIKAAYPGSIVVQITNPDMPQEPKDHPNFWSIWKTALQSLCPGKIDAVFTSEEYGTRLAIELGAEHICVDLSRNQIPISGTAIRAKPYTNWKYLTSPAKSFYNKRVLITGPESCGKSTLTEMLGQCFNTVWAPEFAREYLAEIGYGFSMQDLKNICVGQTELIRQLKIWANKIGFSDTSAIETSIYAKWYLGASDDLIESALPTLKDEFDLALLLTPEVEWVSDGQRNLSENKVRWDVFKLFEDQIKACGIKYEVISGTGYKERLERAVEASRNLIKD